MIEKFNIAGYCRISVDEELDRDNTSCWRRLMTDLTFLLVSVTGISLMRNWN